MIASINKILLLAILLSFLGCSNHGPNTIVEVKLLEDENALLKLSDYWTSDTIVSENGIAKFNINLKNPGYYILRYKKSFTPLYLVPNDKLEIIQNSSSDPISFTYTGNSAQINSFLQQKQKFNSTNNYSYATLNEMSASEFYFVSDSLFKAKNTFLSTFESKNKTLDQHFVQSEYYSNTFSLAQSYLDYLLLNKSKQIHKKLISCTDTININDSNLLSTVSFRAYLLTYTEWLTKQQISRAGELSPHEITLSKMQVISRHFVNGPVKDFLLFTSLADHLKYYGLKNTDLLFKTFDFQCSSKSLKKELTKPYQKYHALKSDEAAPNIELKSIANEYINLNQLQGSYLYIDIWATWCKPCLREAPEFERLKNIHKDKNIEFISISIDDNIDKWEKYCRKNEKFDHQYWIADKKLFLDNYMIKTIPRFIIIDPAGRIINVDANRPSDNKNEWLNDIPLRAIL